MLILVIVNGLNTTKGDFIRNITMTNNRVDMTSI